MLITNELRIEVMKKKIDALMKKESADRYIQVLHNIIEWEKEHPKDSIDGKWGWQMDDIEGLNGGLLNQLLQEGVITQGYYSNQYHHYALADSYDIVEVALDEVEGEREQIASTTFKSHFLENVTVEEEDIQKFKEILREHDGLDYFYKYVCPKVVKMEDEKKAVLLALASHWDEHGDRWRVQVLFYGKDSSGTGKTPILRWIKKLGGGYTSGTRSTRAGLSVSLKDGSPGFLPRYHKSVAAIDELDKAEKYHRDAVLSSGEEGIVPFQAGDIEGEYPAEVIIIAAANDVSCFTPEQLGRWDFRFHISKYSVEDAKTIARYRSLTMGKPKEKETELFMKYLKWIRSRESKISDEVREAGADWINEYIHSTGRTDIRHIESIWRVARSIARLNYRDVTVDDVKRAIHILAKCYRSES